MLINQLAFWLFLQPPPGSCSVTLRVLFSQAGCSPGIFTQLVLFTKRTRCDGSACQRPSRQPGHLQRVHSPPLCSSGQHTSPSELRVDHIMDLVGLCLSLPFSLVHSYIPNQRGTWLSLELRHCWWNEGLKRGGITRYCTDCFCVRD